MKFVSKAQDPWHTCAGEDGPQPHPAAADHKLLTLEQWHAVRDTWPEGLATGVILPNDVDVLDLKADLPRLQLVVLQFPKWVDGRAYSQAHVLRSRLRYAGEVRAIGEVLVDMLPLLQRCGVDAVQMRGDQNQEAAERALGFFPGHYQADVNETRPLFARAGSGGAAGRKAEA